MDVDYRHQPATVSDIRYRTGWPGLTATGPSSGLNSGPIHPAKCCWRTFRSPLGVSQYRLAKDIAVPPRRVNEIVHGLRGISADTALRRARYFGTSAEMWMNLQSWYDLERQWDQAEERILGDVHVLKRTA